MNNLVIDKHGRVIHMNMSKRLIMEKQDAEKSLPRLNPKAMAERKVVQEYARRAGYTV